MPQREMVHAESPAKVLMDQLGDIESVEIFNNQVLVAIYIRPTKTKSGILLPDTHVDEDKYQGKVGLVIKKGPSAFIDEDNKWFQGVNVEVNDWVIFRPSDGWSISVNNTLCRILDDTAVRGKVDAPDRVW